MTKRKEGLELVKVPVNRKTLVEGASRVLLEPYLADAIRQVAKHDRLRASELIERCLVLYIDKHHPDWKKREKKVEE